ncbi:MAG: ABC transporter permease [Egibacteraceae bacterium]
MTAESPAATRVRAPARIGSRIARLEPRYGAIAAAILLALMLLGAIFAGVIRPAEYLVSDLGSVLEAPSAAHPLGTDEVGRDVLAIILRGMRVSFSVSLAAAVLALVIGGSFGVLAGSAGGWVDGLMMRGVDFLSSQSHLLFGILIAVLARPVVGGAGAIMLSVGLTHWMLLARVLRAEVLSLKERQFVAAAINAGATRRQLIVRHLIPNLAPAAGLGFVLLVPHAIFHESALSFLGVGLPVDQPSLGTLISAGQRTLFAGAWWVILFPGLLIVLASICVGTLGEWWRDRTQPRWRAELEL